MEEQQHWAYSLQVGDRCQATIRHKTDGSKNLVDVPVIVAAVDRRRKFVIAIHDVKEPEAQVPFMDLKPERR